MPLSKEAALALLKEDDAKPKRGERTRQDPTAVRDFPHWFKLNHHIKENGCDNPECTDPRPKNDMGTNIVVDVKGKMICRYCFLAGYLL